MKPYTDKNKSYPRLNEAALGYLLVTPALLFILAIAIYPIFQTFRLSLFNMKLQFITEAKFIGLENYINLLGDWRYLLALLTTARFTVFSVALELCVGMAMALLMSRNFKGIGLVRTAVLVPWAIPTSVSAVMWSFLYNDQFGVLNDILTRFGIISANKAWLGTADTALGSIIFADVWKTSPFMGLILLAGVQSISRELYEAARVDGAGVIRQFLSITLPLLKPTILVALIFRTMEAFRVFDLIFVMTSGGPGNSTESLAIYTYKTLFRNLDFGQGSAMAVMIFVFVFLFAMLYIKLLDKDSLH